MSKFLAAFKAIGFAVIILAAASAANAQASRTWVSGVGDDVNPCSRTAPCKTFAGAISKTAINGEINCLDSGGFGAVTIIKSITIDCTSTQGGILASGTTGIIINITSGTDNEKAVRLRGLNINGFQTGINGIRIIAADSVDIQDTVIDGFSVHGISLEYPSKLTVHNSTIRNVKGNGINTFVTFHSAAVTISNTNILNSVVGINLSNGTKATLTNSRVAGHTTGVLAYNADISVSGSDVSNNTTGFVSYSGGTIRLSGNTITSNGTGLNPSGGSIVSLGNNSLQGNTAAGAPTSTVTLQ